MKLYTCSLLLTYPDRDVALCNPGAFRDTVKKGVVKKSDIISILPFENSIVLSTISGNDLIFNLNLSEKAFCGVVKLESGWHISGTPVDPDGQYKVVINDFMYGGGDNYRFIGGNNKSVITSVNWRTPLINYLKKWKPKKRTLKEIIEIQNSELKKTKN